MSHIFVLGRVFNLHKVQRSAVETIKLPLTDCRHSQQIQLMIFVTNVWHFFRIDKYCQKAKEEKNVCKFCLNNDIVIIYTKKSTDIAQSPPRIHQIEKKIGFFQIAFLY